ncbi:MAG: hypothetical protein ACJ79E_16675, partial [Anaeromyxobacteraceae bacterium]
DGDGAGEGDPVMLCYGFTPPRGFTTAPTDCAPGDRTRWQLLSYTYRDADGDGWVVSQSGSICTGASLPAGYSNTFVHGFDCDDADPAVFQAMSGYPDADGDGFGAEPSQVLCTGGALPAGFVATTTPLDCAPDDPARWRTVTNPFVDRDGDGFTARDPGSICIGATFPDPYRAAANGNDCDDADPALWRWLVLYPDRDGDGVGAPPREVQCRGATLPPGYALTGWDVNDADPRVQAAVDDGVLGAAF